MTLAVKIAAVLFLWQESRKNSHSAIFTARRKNSLGLLLSAFYRDPRSPEVEVKLADRVEPILTLGSVMLTDSVLLAYAWDNNITKKEDREIKDALFQFLKTVHRKV